jgi:DNA invertase Pin-like site-specific DNA recombinase
MKLFGYARVSTDEQELSLEAQEKDIKRYCLANGHELIKIYVDEDVSAYKELSKRPQGAILLEKLKTTPDSGVVCTRVDRMFRNALDGMAVVKRWNASNTTLYVVTMGGNVVVTSSAMGWLLFQTMLIHAEFERNITSERTKSVKSMLRDGNRKYSNTAPYGWMHDDSDSLVKDPEKWEIVKAIFEFKKRNLSLEEISKEVNKLWRNAGMYKQQVNRILKHELNTREIEKREAA